MRPDRPEEQIKRPFLKSYEKTPSSYGFTSKLVAKREGGYTPNADERKFEVDPVVKEKSKLGKELA